MITCVQELKEREDSVIGSGAVEPVDGIEFRNQYAPRTSNIANDTGSWIQPLETQASYTSVRNEQVDVAALLADSGCDLRQAFLQGGIADKGHDDTTLHV